MSKLLHTIDACNGEIRIKAGRYIKGWYCLVVPVEPADKVWEAWDDLTGGDNDYFAAEAYFSGNASAFLRSGLTPVDAISLAMKEAAQWCDEQSAANGGSP